VFGAIHDGNPTHDVVAIKYLEALTRVADGQATKIFLPTEMSGLFGAVGGLAELLRAETPVGERVNGVGRVDGEPARTDGAP
jgi:hypothetical protein